MYRYPMTELIRNGFVQRSDAKAPPVLRLCLFEGLGRKGGAVSTRGLVADYRRLACSNDGWHG